MLRIILDKDNIKGQEFLFNVITISAEALRGLLAKEVR